MKNSTSHENQCLDPDASNDQETWHCLIESSDIDNDIQYLSTQPIRSISSQFPAKSSGATTLSSSYSQHTLPNWNVSLDNQPLQSQVFIDHQHLLQDDSASQALSSLYSLSQLLTASQIPFTLMAITKRSRGVEVKKSRALLAIESQDCFEAENKAKRKAKKDVAVARKVKKAMRHRKEDVSQLEDEFVEYFNELRLSD